MIKEIAIGASALFTVGFGISHYLLHSKYAALVQSTIQKLESLEQATVKEFQTIAAGVRSEARQIHSKVETEASEIHSRIGSLAPQEPRATPTVRTVPTR